MENPTTTTDLVDQEPLAAVALLAVASSTCKLAAQVNDNAIHIGQCATQIGQNREASATNFQLIQAMSRQRWKERLIQSVVWFIVIGLFCLTCFYLPDWITAQVDSKVHDAKERLPRVIFVPQQEKGGSNTVHGRTDSTTIPPSDRHAH